MTVTQEDLDTITNRCFVFDVDGTLTPSRGKIDAEFSKFFFDFCTLNHVYLVTGSDRSKTIEQIGNVLYGMSRRVYNCSGNSVWEKGVNVYNNDWKLDDEPWKYLESVLLYNRFEPKTGWHFDERPGLINFSIVGRRANGRQRKMYVEWDTKNSERSIIANQFNERFKEKYGVTAQVAGETGLDIIQTGKGKQQILNDLSHYDSVIFFGDKCEVGGNDYDISQAVQKLPNGIVYPVTGWQHTYNILKRK